MSKQSKTAAAAAKAVARGEKPKSQERTPEERLRQIRLNLDARLAVTPEDQRMLFGLYESALLRITELETLCNTLEAEGTDLAARLKGEEEKRVGQLDIILRTIQGEGGDSLAADYGGLGWEAEEPVFSIRRCIGEIRRHAEELPKRILGDEF